MSHTWKSVVSQFSSHNTASLVYKKNISEITAFLISNALLNGRPVTNGTATPGAGGGELTVTLSQRINF